MLLLKLFLILLPIYSSAFLWSRRLNTLDKLELSITTEQSHNQYADIDELRDDEDYQSLQLNLDALRVYSTRKPDCFKRAASIIRNRCTDLDMDEDARVNAAITMTLCEVATAKHYSLPHECLPYSFDQDQAHTTRRQVSAQTQGECVDSLARSAQFWSSYSGYLREVPQLCYAFRRWNDIDLARDIYYNATVEKLALIRFMTNREKKSGILAEEWTKRAREMQELDVEMKTLAGEYRSDMVNFMMELHEELNATLTNFWETNYNLFSLQEASNSRSVALVETTLVDILHRHSGDLHAILGSLEPTLALWLDKNFLGHEARHQQLDILFSDTQTRWMEFVHDMNGMKQDILKLSDHATQTSGILVAAMIEAEGIRDIQSEASLAATELVKTVTLLTETAHAELETINGTAYLIKQHLQIQSDAKRPWKLWLIKILEILYKGDPSSLSSLEKLFPYRLLVWVFSFGWMAFRIFLSAVTSVFMVLFLVTRKVFLERTSRILSTVLDRRAGSATTPMEVEPKKKESELPQGLPPLVSQVYFRRMRLIPLAGASHRSEDRRGYAGRISHICQA